MNNLNVDLEFSPQTFLVGLNYHTSNDGIYYYHTWELYALCFRLTFERFY